MLHSSFLSVGGFVTFAKSNAMALLSQTKDACALRGLYLRASISIIVGKGSIAHNSRTFVASNVDKDRIKMNHVYIHSNIQDAYHHLFYDALIKYNDKQTRSDRIINDYYEKIRTGKQEKTFHEIIVQVGNKDTMNVLGPNGALAEKILDDYMKSFIERNPNLHVFSAHLHMDEETPHLHIDFIPFTTNSKRGLETRVSLKKALDQQGFKGGSKSQTEMQQWINSEKEKLSTIMLEHGVEWENLETKEQHLSVLDFKKKKRSEEVIALENKVNELQYKIEDIKYDEQIIDKVQNIIEDKTIWNIPDPKNFMSAKSYKNEIIIPFVKKIKESLQFFIRKYIDISKQLREIKNTILPLKLEISELERINDKLYDENRDYRQKFNKLAKIFGRSQLNDLLNTNRIQDNKRKER